MALAQAMWAHGHSMVVEYPDNLRSEWRAGYFIRVVGKPNTTNWFHFAIPTPVIVDDNRLAIDSCLVRFRSNSPNAMITNVHIFDGENRIAASNNLTLAPATWNMHRFTVPTKQEVLWGIGVTLGVKFIGDNDDENTIEISSAGVDFLP
jgi:hypothetical protein